MYFETSIDTFVIALFIGLLALAAIYDVTEYRISNRINFAIAALYPAHVMAATVPVDWVGGLVVAAIMFVLGVFLFLARTMGGGDVKLIAVVALWAGPALVAEYVLVMAITGGAMAIVLSSPLRHGLALAFEKFGNEESRDAVLDKVLPYGLAIAAGGLVVAIRLLTLSHA